MKKAMNVVKVLAMVFAVVAMTLVFAGCSGGKLSVSGPPAEELLKAANEGAIDAASHGTPTPRNVWHVVGKPQFTTHDQISKTVNGIEIHVTPIKVTAEVEYRQPPFPQSKYKVEALVHFYKNEVGEWKYETVDGNRTKMK